MKPGTKKERLEILNMGDSTLTALAGKGNIGYASRAV